MPEPAISSGTRPWRPSRAHRAPASARSGPSGASRAPMRPERPVAGGGAPIRLPKRVAEIGQKISFAMLVARKLG